MDPWMVLSVSDASPSRTRFASCTRAWPRPGNTPRFLLGPNPNLDVEHEPQRWLAVHPHGDATSFRAGWARLARFVGPKLREWEARWWRSMHDNDRLRARLGNALREISRLTDSG